MALVTRTVSGVLERGDAEPIASGEVTFVPSAVFGGGATTVPVRKFTVATDENGAFSVDLYTFDSGGVRYECRLPSGDGFAFDLTAGSEVSLETLRQAAAAAPPVTAYPHSALSGLSADDHTQYFNTARGDARYALSGHNHSGVYAPVGHGHVAADISDFAATVRSTVLTGLAAGSNTPIAATDTILAAFANLQAQISGFAGISIGNAVSGGGANRVLYEDGSQNLAASANLTFDGNALNVASKAFTTDLVSIHGSTYSGSLGYSARFTTDNASRTPLQIVGVTSQLNPLLAIYDSTMTLNGRWDANGAITVAGLTCSGDIGTSSGNSILLGDTSAAANGFYAYFKTGNVGRTAVVMQAIAAQNNPVLEIQDSTAAAVARFMPDGKFGLNAASPAARLHLISTSNLFRAGYDTSNYVNVDVSSTGGVTFDAVGSGAGFTFSDDVTLADAKNIVLNTTTGTKIGTSTAQKLAFFNSTPIVQVTTGVTAATFTANAGTAVNDASTFDGYTIGQLVKALRNFGLLA